MSTAPTLAEMREVAARLGIYRNLYHLDMTADYAPQIAEHTQPDDGPYDAPMMQ